MDKLNGVIYYPTVCLFETEKEADLFIKLNEDKTLAFTRRKVYVGKMKTKLKIK